MSLNDEERTLRRQLVYSSGVSRTIEDELAACEASNAEAWGEVDLLRAKVAELEGALRGCVAYMEGKSWGSGRAIKILADARAALTDRAVEGTPNG